MPRSPRYWPDGALPRVMGREMAAFYCGVSPNSLDALVKAGKLPPPKAVHGRRVAWDRCSLDAHLDRLFGTGADEAEDTRRLLQERTEQWQAKALNKRR